MSESLHMQLQQAANKALNSENTEDRMKYLAKAFTLFSQEAGRLKNSYLHLQDRFETVNTNLDDTNIALRKKNKDLSKLNNYLDNILKKISQGIIFIDTDGVITTYNEEAQKILNICEEKVLFQKYENIFEDDLLGFSMKEALRVKVSYANRQAKLEKDNESDKQLEVSTTYLHEDDKAYTGMIILLRDITKLKKLQIVANRNDRMKELGEMAATVAHEIRNPLGGIRGFASLLYRDLEDSKHLQEMAGYIIEGTKTLERLVNNVLHYSRPIELKHGSVDICKFMKKLCKFVQSDPTFPENIDLEVHIPKDKIMVSIDEGLFHSAILNIIVNAYQAIKDNGLITISILKNNNTCMISISDTGRGIAETDIEKIFSPFFTTKERGNGLGLPEAYKIIQAHLGSIDVRSTLFSGTTFTINIAIS